MLKNSSRTYYSTPQLWRIYVFCDVQGRTKEQQQTDMGFQTNYGGIQPLLPKHKNTHCFVGGLFGDVQVPNLSHTEFLGGAVRFCCVFM